MKTFLMAILPIALLVALLALATTPAFAQGPTTSPVTTTTTVTTTTSITTTTPLTTTTPVTTTPPTGKTVGDSLPITCDWTYMPPAPAPGYYSDLFYRVPYQKSTQLVVYVSALPKPDPNNFRFEVYTPYNSALRSLFDEVTVTTWDNWKGDPAGSSMPNKWELGDLSWSGMLNAGAADGYYTVDVLNFNTTAVWFNLCSRSYVNVR